MSRLFKMIFTKKKETFIFISCLLIAVMLYTRLGQRLPMPFPTAMIEHLLNPLVKPILHWIQGGAYD